MQQWKEDVLSTISGRKRKIRLKWLDDGKENEVIDKEKIGALRFPILDILEDNDEAISERNESLRTALALGNLERIKAKIYFEDDSSKKVVETTVWGVTDKRVILKQGVVIPINRIYKVHIHE